MKFGFAWWKLAVVVFISLTGIAPFAESSRKRLFEKTNVLEVTIDFTDLPTSQRLVASRNKNGSYKVTCFMINKQAPGSSRQASLEIGSDELENFGATAELANFKVKEKSSEHEKTSVHNLRDVVSVRFNSEGRPAISRTGYAELNPSCVKAVDKLFSRAFNWH